MDEKTLIANFAKTRPSAEAVYSFETGVVEPSYFDENFKPQHEALFVVNDIVNWELKNIRRNPNDYSYTGSKFIESTDIEFIKCFNPEKLQKTDEETLKKELKRKLKGKNGNIFHTSAFYGTQCCHYYVVEASDFVRNLEKWENFFIAGKFHRPFQSILTKPLYERIIKQNQRSALIIAALFEEEETDVRNLLNKICNLSYIGTARKNSFQLNSIINAGYNELLKFYCLDDDFIDFYGNNQIHINHEKLLQKLGELPIDLRCYFISANVDKNNLASLRQAITAYFTSKNQQEEFNQAIHSLCINGPIKSAKYVGEFIKRFKPTR